MKDSAAETTGVEEGDSLTRGQGEEHSHQNLQAFHTDVCGGHLQAGPQTLGEKSLKLFFESCSRKHARVHSYKWKRRQRGRGQPGRLKSTRLPRSLKSNR